MRFGLKLFLVAIVGSFLIYAVRQPRHHHRYSDVPGQDHPYCPPDPRECD